MTSRPAAASRVAVTGMSVAGTMLGVAWFSHTTATQEAEKAHDEAVAMRKWNAQQAKADREARRWAKNNPVVVTKTVERKVYVQTGSTGASGASGSGATAASSQPSTTSGSSSGSSSGSVSSPAPAAPPPPAPAAPAPATSSGGS